MSAELSAYLDRVQYGADPLVLDGMAAIIGDRHAVVLQGAVLGSPDFSLCHYAAYYGDNRSTVLQAIDPLIAKLRTKSILDVRQHCADIQRVIGRQFLT